MQTQDLRDWQGEHIKIRHDVNDALEDDKGAAILTKGDGQGGDIDAFDRGGNLGTEERGIAY